ncbi:MAG: hypothetical protein ABSH39_22130 [Candidatus Acidiferrum sp.]|jgi:hypothetical protein
MKEMDKVGYGFLVAQVGARIFAVSNAVKGTNLTIESGIEKAKLLLSKITAHPCHPTYLPAVLEVAGMYWAVKATGDSAKDIDDAVSKAVKLVQC